MIHQPVFSTIISIASYENNEEEAEKLTPYCLNLEKTKRKDIRTDWISKNTFNTLGTLDIGKEDKFKDINNWVFEQVEIYRKTVGYLNPMKYQQGWFNVYKKYDFQEYHHHSKCFISAIYFLNSNENNAKVFFKSPTNMIVNRPNPNQGNPFTWDKVIYKPIQGNLIIFPAHLEHCVEQQENDDIRISLAYNFDLCLEN